MHMPIQVIRSGRKPNQGNRFKCGKLKPDSAEAIIATALAPRLRAGVAYEQAVVRDERGKVVGANQHAGHTLGLLRMRGPKDPGGISEAQFDAGWAYAQIVRRHSSIMGYSLGSPKSPGFEMVSSGISLAGEPDEEVIMRARRQFTQCYDALVGIGTRVATVTYDVCIDRIKFVDLQADKPALGNLRVGLNALGRVLR
jgi:hypothetical protein